MTHLINYIAKIMPSCIKLLVVYKNILEDFGYEMVFWKTWKAYEVDWDTWKVYEVDWQGKIEEVWITYPIIKELKEKTVFGFYFIEKEDFIGQVDPKVLLFYLIFVAIIFLEEEKGVEKSAKQKQTLKIIEEEELLENENEEGLEELVGELLFVLGKCCV